MNIPQAIATPDQESTEPSWIDEFHDLSVDELREMPHHLQLGFDLSALD